MNLDNNGNFYAQNDQMNYSHQFTNSCENNDQGSMGSGVQYTEQANLQNFPQNLTFDQISQQINLGFNDPDWMNCFRSIDALRILNKYHPQEINTLMNMFGEHVIKSLNNTRPFIAKNIMAFLIEALSAGRTYSLSDQIVFYILPIILQKFVSSNKALLGMYEVSVELIINNFLGETIIQILCKHTSTKHKAVNIKSTQFLMSCLRMIQSNIKQLNIETINCIIQCIAILLNSDCGESKQSCKEFLQFFRGQIGDQGYLDYLHNLFNSGLLNQIQAESVFKAAESKSEVRKSMADMLREKSIVNLKSRSSATF